MRVNRANVRVWWGGGGVNESKSYEQMDHSMRNMRSLKQKMKCLKIG